MTAFRTPIDIANRALQHVGGRRIASLTEDSRNASEVNACYDALREAELRRNVWRFAIRKAALRPIDTDTKLFAPVAWAIGTTYAVGAVVSYDNQIWQTDVSSLGAAPGLTTSPWNLYFGPMTVSLHDATETYFAGELVYVSTTVYLSLISNNDDTPPTANWVSLGAASAALTILYPLSTGPVAQSATRNVYRLPANYLRKASQDPKAGSSNFMGAPSAAMYDDWEFEGDYLVTRDITPLIFRFVANTTGVSKFDPMFCEGLAARIAIEVCEPLTQSTAKQQTLAAMYSKFMGEARIVNGIETGSEESPEDDFIACRQ